MLNLLEKIECFGDYISIKNENYGDVMKDEIYLHFFEKGNSLDFLDKLENEKDIKDKIEFIVSKMILNEHQDSLPDIIVNYI